MSRSIDEPGRDRDRDRNNPERFRVETVRAHYLHSVPEFPPYDDDAESGDADADVNIPPPPPILESPLKRLWSRRRSSFNPNLQQLTLSHYLTKEVIPNLDNYRMTAGREVKSRRLTMDELLNDAKLEMADDDVKPATQLKGKIIKFTWLEGVFMRCLLNIWGVMLFLRLTWVIGQAGLIEGLLIIGLCNIVTIITGLSMSAVCTNGQIKAGGIYYMISRALGPEFGGAIGLMFTLANSIAVSMYLIGFVEALLDMLEQYVDGFTSILHAGRINDIRLISCVTLIGILALAIVGMDWVTRVQMGLLVLLCASQVDFVIGTFIAPTDEQRAKGFVGYSAETFMENLFSQYTYDYEADKMNSFFTVFAVFFPAVTGIVAGANLSGDLRDPATAIPKGTMLAIFFTMFTYLCYGLLSGGCSIRYASGVVSEVLFARGELNETTIEELGITQTFDNCTGRVCSFGLIQSQQMMENMSAWGPLIYAGCFAATLSSAIASLVGAPRVFQAVCKDKIYPGLFFFAKGYGANNDPVRGYCLVFVITVICILIGNLNQVSTLLSNFFIAAYALINFSVFHASTTKSPGWRPTFKYANRWISLIGTFLCLAVMFLMDYRTAIATYIIILLLYIVIHIRNPEANWGSSAQSLTFLSALRSVQTLEKVDDHVKNYRPKIILFSGEPSDRPCLVDFCNLITKHLSLLECVNIVNEDIGWKTIEANRTRLSKWLSENNIKAFYTLIRNREFSNGARIAMEMAGLGKLSPNMMMIGFQEKWFACPDDATDFVKTLQAAFDLHLAVGVLRVGGGLDLSSMGHTKDHLDSKTKDMMQKTEFSSSTSVDSGLSITELKRSSSAEKNIFERMMSRKDPNPGPPKEVLTVKEGLTIEDETVVKAMTQFRGKSPKEGTIDVYWLYDDGGLTLLLPYILKTRAKFSKCQMRVFFLANKMNTLDEEARSMAALLTKFRIEFQDVILLTDVTQRPNKATRQLFQDLITVLPKSGYQGLDKTPLSLVADEDLELHREKTNFYLRIAEIVRENSVQSSLIVMTLPLPKKESLPPLLYMAWLDFISQRLPPFLFIRGNQDSVLTFYS